MGMTFYVDIFISRYDYLLNHWEGGGHYNNFRYRHMEKQFMIQCKVLDWVIFYLYLRFFWYPQFYAVDYFGLTIDLYIIS